MMSETYDEVIVVSQVFEKQCQNDTLICSKLSSLLNRIVF